VYPPGTDNLNIKDIGSLTPDEMVEKVKAIMQGGATALNLCAERKSQNPMEIPALWVFHVSGID
jgi:hypothetical protein